MKRLYKYLAVGALGVIAAVPLLSGTPVLADLKQAGEAIVEAIKGPQVKLVMTADKKLVKVDEKGKEEVTWQSLADGATVNPGDTLRYKVNSNNDGDLAAKNLNITQPIPEQMVYVLGSAASNNGAKITFSIDQGQSFVDQPMIKKTLADGTVVEEPAPADMYTHIRWQFGKNLEVAAGVEASYELQVK